MQTHASIKKEKNKTPPQQEIHRHLKTVNNFEISYYFCCHHLNIPFFPPVPLPVVTAGTKQKEPEKAELRQIKGSVC